MASQKASQYDYSTGTAFLSDMDAGRDDGDTLNAGVPAEMSAVEIGAPNHGEFSDYFILAMGGFPDSQLKTGAARISGDIQDGSNAEVPNKTQLRIRVTDKQRNNTYWKTRWYDVKSEIQASNIENRPFLEFEGVTDADFFREGRVITVDVRNPTNTFTVSHANSSLQWPIVGGA